MKREDPDLACQRVVEMVTDYLEGALEQDAGAQLEQHLLICDACSIYVDQHRTLAHALSHLTPPQAASEPDTGKSAALAAFRKLKKSEER